MQNDMIKLNTYLHKEKGIHVDLHQGNILLENDFMRALKVNILYTQHDVPCDVLHVYKTLEG